MALGQWDIHMQRVKIDSLTLQNIQKLKWIRGLNVGTETTDLLEKLYEKIFMAIGSAVIF